MSRGAKFRRESVLQAEGSIILRSELGEEASPRRITIPTGGEKKNMGWDEGSRTRTAAWELEGLEPQKSAYA